MLHFFSAADTYPQNSWSLWSYCFIYPPVFIFHSLEGLTDWLTNWLTGCLEFSQVVWGSLITWQTSARIKLWINSSKMISVIGGMKPPCLPSSVGCGRRVTAVQTEMSPFSFTFLPHMKNLIIPSLCFLELALFCYLYEHPGVLEVSSRKDQLAWLKRLPRQRPGREKT